MRLRLFMQEVAPSLGMVLDWVAVKPYGWTKATNTELVQNFGDWFGVPYAIVYFYNAYGQT